MATTKTIPMIFDREFTRREGEKLPLNFFSGYAGPQGDRPSWTLSGIKAFDPDFSKSFGSSSLNDFPQPAATSDIATVSLTTEVVNEAPAPSEATTFQVIEGEIFAGFLTDYVNDPDDTALGFRLLGIDRNPSTGDIPEGYSNNFFKLTAGGLFHYDSRYLNLQPGQQQTETFHYLVTDGENSSLGSFSITVVGSDFGGAPPAAPNDYAMTVQGRPVLLNLVANDTLRENPFETVTNVAISDITGLSSSEGSWQINPATSPFDLPTLIYTPAPGFTGDATFTYTLNYQWYREESSDVNAGVFNANVTVRVVPGTSLSAPDGVADTYNLSLLPSFNIGTLQGVLANDLAVPDGGIAAQLVSGPSQGTLDFNADGSFTYYASAEMLASAPGTDHQVTFTYQALNSSAEDTDATLVTLNLRNAVSAPIAVNDVLNGVEDTPLVITPQSLFGVDGAGPQNDSQADGQAFTEIRITRLPATGTLLLDGVAVNVNAPISVAQLEAGRLVFVPLENYSGSTSFDYIVRSSDSFSDPATVTLSIANTLDPAVLVSPPLEPLIFVEAADAAAQVLSAPLGPLQFLDPDSPSLFASFSTLLLPSNPAIVVPPSVVTALENAISFTQTVIPSGAGSLLTVFPASPTFNVGPLNLDFLPAGEDLVLVHRVIVEDGTGMRSGLYDVQVVIGGSNDAPVAGNIEAQMSVGGTVAADAGLLTQVRDPDSGDTLKFVSINGQPQGFSSLTEVATEVGSLLIFPDGGYTFRPNPQGIAMARSESQQINVSFEVADKVGATSTGTLSLTIWGTNEGPEAVPDQIGPVLAGDSTQFTDTVLLANDIDPDNGENALLKLAAFSFGGTVVAMPVTGTTTLAGTYGVLTIGADGQLSYAATTDASTALIKGAQAIDTFSYTITDPSGASSQTQLTFNVTGANRAPTSAADSYTLTSGQTLAVSTASGVLSNDSDNDGDTLSAVLQSGPANGSLVLNANGSFTYIPSAGFVGTDSFIYQASDGSTSSASTQVSITVQPAPPPPPPTLNLDKKFFINEIAVNAGAATITINTNNGALPDRVTTGVGRIELFNFSSSSISATDLSKASVEVVGLNSKLSVIGLDHLTGLTETASGAPLAGVALQSNGSLVLYEPNAAGIGIWQTYSASGALLLSGTYQDNSWGLGASVLSPIAMNLVEQGVSIDFFAANGAPLSGLTDTASTQTSLSGIAALASGSHAQGSITPFQLPDLSSPWFGSAQVSPSGVVIPNDVLNLLSQNGQFSGLLASTSDTVFARTHDRYLAATGGSDAAFVDYNDAGDWIYGGSGVLTLGRENVVLSRGAPQFVANPQDAADNVNPLQGYQPVSDLIAGISNESGQTIAIFSGVGEGVRGHDFLYGVATNDNLLGHGGNDYLYGSDGNDTLEGGSGADRLMGGADSDRLIGGSGRDWLNGGSGADIFIFRNLSDSSLAASDIIEDFTRGIDKIDLSAIDANTKRAGDQTFVFAGQSGRAVANSVSWFESSGNTVVQVEVDGNRGADMQLILVGTNLGLTAADFVL